MSLTRRAIDNTRVTLTALVVVGLAGLSAYTQLPRAMDPGFIIRVAQVMTIFPGASPERVENLVTDKIEKAVQEIPELDFVNSESKAGVSVVYVNIKEKFREMRPIWDKVRRKVDDVALPDGIIGPNVNDEFGDVFGVIMTITGDGYAYTELKDIADEIRDEMLRLSEVAKVEILGAQDERIFIEYTSARLLQLGLSPYQLMQILQSRNIIIPGGEIRTHGESIALEPSGNFESVDDLRRTLVRLPQQSQVLYLEDIVDIRRGYLDPPDRRMRHNAETALGLAVSLRDGGNISVLGTQIQELSRRLPGLYPHGVDFDFVSFLPTNVDTKVEDFVVNVLQSVVIVLVVMLLFLGLRTGLMVASLIPTAMLATLFFMSVFDIGLDQMSLASLIIALGMLVDNAIVMSESILVKVESGMSKIDASVASAAELRIPLLTSSLTTSAAFLPIFLAQSAVGEYTAPLFKVVSLTLLSSWVLALTMTPLLCVLFLHAKVQGSGDGTTTADPFASAFYRAYRTLLMWILRWRYLVFAAVMVVFFGVMSLFGLIPQAFFPSDESPQFTAEFNMPIGTTIERTEEVVHATEAFMKAELMAETGPGPGAGGGSGDMAVVKEGIINWSTFIGGGAPKYSLGYTPKPPSPEAAIMIINTTSPAAVDITIPKMERFVRDQFPDLDAKIRGLLLGPPVDNPVEVRLSGKDTDELFALVDQVKAKMREIPGTRNITDDWGARGKKIAVEVDQARAYRAGLSNQDIAVSLNTNLSGFETSQYREGDDVIPIVMRSVAADRSDLGKLESLNIYAQATGRNVPLKQVAETVIAWEPAKILRRNRLRTVTVRSQLAPGVSAAEINAALLPWLEAESVNWALGYRYELGGEYETSGKANESINVQMPVAGLIILLLLISQFNSYRRTIIILSTIVLALIGVTLGLLATDSYFGFMTLLGIISLAGIVINNAIVLIERIDLEIKENGLTPQQAVIMASQQRLRPILLTTATTIGGLIPLWFGGGPMWEPMAIAIIFGLAFSTVLTLGVVPALYAMLFRISYRNYAYDMSISAPGTSGAGRPSAAPSIGTLGERSGPAQASVPQQLDGDITYPAIPSVRGTIKGDTDGNPGDTANKDIDSDPS